jgi:uncharacterized membrane protein YgcG
MTRTADDAAAEDAFEAALAGRPVSAGAAGRCGVAAFPEAVRTTALQPGRPSAALADLFANGLLTDQSSPSTRTAPAAGNPSRSRSRRRRRFAMFIPALFAKLLSAGAVAQAATGAGIAVVVVTGAGAAGVLPDPVQSTFASLVSSEDVTSGETAPSDMRPEDTGTPTADPARPEPVESEVDPEVEPMGSVPTETPAAEPQLTLPEWEAGPAPDQSFGDWVSSGARLGYANGEIVRKWAHLKHVELPEDDATEDAGTPTGGTGTDVAEGDDDADRSEDSGTRNHDRGNGNADGHGNGNGNGQANSGDHGNGHSGGSGNSGRGGHSGHGDR